jgi:dCMP deaminase
MGPDHNECMACGRSDLNTPREGEAVKRPDWDIYFMIIADAVSLRMSCDRARIGAVIVSPEHRILSTGYGGAPSGWPSCDEVGHELVDINGRQSCIRTVHAEENAIVTAARHGVRLDGGTLYTTASTCYDCAKMVAQAGIKRIVYGAKYDSARSGSIDIIALMTERGVEMVHRRTGYFVGPAMYKES